jgi:putative Holliday junction resolvase
MTECKMPIGLLRDILDKKPREGRLIGLDQGTKRTGVAISDPMQSIASAIEVIERKKFSVDVKRLKEIYDEYEVKGFIIGYPLNMDGTEGPRCDSVKDYALNIKQTGLFGTDPWIAFYDERLSTAAAQDFLIEQVDMNRRRRSQVIDKMAAQNILQGALDCF